MNATGPDSKQQIFSVTGPDGSTVLVDVPVVNKRQCCAYDNVKRAKGAAFRQVYKRAPNPNELSRFDKLILESELIRVDLQTANTLMEFLP